MLVDTAQQLLAFVGCSAAWFGVLASKKIDSLKELLVFFLILFGACAGIVAFTVAQFMAPIRRLEQRADAMARGELADPVAAGGEGDEIGRLTLALEEMRRALRDKLRSTEEVNLDLERAVQMRTADLARKNRELAETLDKLTRAQEQLVRSEKLASIGQLVAGIAHEINNPVNAVINSLGPLEQIVHQIRAGTPDPGAAGLARSAEEMLNVIQRGAARTKAIVQALHNYSRGDEAVAREVSLARSVEDSLDLLRHRLRNVTVVKEVDPAARIVGMPGQIDQVLMNLLTNAAQALGEDGGTIRIAVVTAGASVHIVVNDDGPGIPPEVLPRIFDPFFTTKEVGKGTGQGLAIARSVVVDKHQGTIDVETQEGKGTAFIIRLPYEAVPLPSPDLAVA